jgi:hypothetical protein
LIEGLLLIQVAGRRRIGDVFVEVADWVGYID